MAEPLKALLDRWRAGVANLHAAASDEQVERTKEHLLVRAAEVERCAGELQEALASARVDRLIAVDGCRHCGLPKRLPDSLPHAQRWTDEAGWHAWAPPTQQQTKARMLARRHATLPNRIEETDR